MPSFDKALDLDLESSVHIYDEIRLIAMYLQEDQDCGANLIQLLPSVPNNHVRLIDNESTEFLEAIKKVITTICSQQGVGKAPVSKLENLYPGAYIVQLQQKVMLTTTPKELQDCKDPRVGKLVSFSVGSLNVDAFRSKTSMLSKMPSRRLQAP